MKNISFRAQKAKSTFCGVVSRDNDKFECRAYVVGVVLLQKPAPALVDILVALSTATHTERRIHVHVVTSQI
jgi:hypothetical protein